MALFDSLAGLHFLQTNGCERHHGVYLCRELLRGHGRDSTTTPFAPPTSSPTEILSTYTHLGFVPFT
eukprot:scaffold7743_cov148-Skeletonema_menzelii.AAC.2